MLTRPVGSAFEYSNVNYNLLGLIIEAASGESYADYIQKHIFTPLGMSHTYTSQAVAKQNGLAVGHRYWFAIPFAAPNLPIPHGSLPAGLLISSAEDMAHYLIAHLNGGRYGDAQILSPAPASTSCTAGWRKSVTMGVSVGQYGMGWFDQRDRPDAGSSGTAAPSPTLLAYMALLPEQKKGVVLLFNADHHWMNSRPGGGRAGVAALLAGEQPAPSPFWLHPLGAARPAAHPASPDCRRRRHAAAVTPLAPGSGAPPEPWTQVGAAHPAPADPEPVVSRYPGIPAGQRHAPLPDALHARLFLDRPDLRQLCAGMELSAHRVDPREHSSSSQFPRAGNSISANRLATAR